MLDYIDKEQQKRKINVQFGEKKARRSLGLQPKHMLEEKV